MSLSRRSFLASLAATVPLAIVVRRAHAAAVEYVQGDPATLDALALTVLPSQLGRAGIMREAASFRDWAAKYRENAELVHGYGTSRLRTTGPTPMTRWAAQLEQLDADAQKLRQRRFRDLSATDREQVVRDALKGERLDRMPPVVDANHVAVALLAHFYDSAGAADLCYEAQIGRQTCRPLAAQASKPRPVLKVLEK
jgi:hypothetical protein